MDTISKITGDFGVWQLRTILIIFLCKIPASWFMACVIFTAPEPRSYEFTCKYGKETDQCFYDSNTKNVNNNQLLLNRANQLPCTEFEHNAKFYSLVMQFDLVCDRDILVAWTQYWHLFGVLLGGIIATKLMIYLSPKRVLLCGILLQMVCGCLTGFLDNFNLHCLFRCLSAICCALMFTSGQTIFSEITGGLYRIGALVLFDTFWSIGVILLPTLASYFTSWKYIYLGISLPTSSLLILYYWIPEAPRWLLKHKRIEQVEQILLNAAQINDRIYLIPVNLKQALQYDSINLRNSMKSEGNWIQMWSNNKQTKINLIAAHLALAIYITNFNGMLLNIRSFSREYLPTNTVLTAISEIFGCFFALHIILKHNHNKWQIAGFYNIIAGLIGCLGWFFPTNVQGVLRVTLWMLISSIAKAGVSLSQSMLLACIPELINSPNHKTIFMFSCIVWARIWLLTAPFINVLKKIDTAMSLSFFSILSLIGGVATCCLKIPTITISTASLSSAEASSSPLATIKLSSGKADNAVATTNTHELNNDIENSL